MSTRAKVSFVVVTGVAALLGIGMCSSGHESAKPASRAALPAKPAAPAPALKPPQRERFMPRDGAYEMGGLDGRYWGVWQATAPGPSRCSWAIRKVSRSARAGMLATGEAGPGEPVRVDIEPDGSVSSTGIIGDHRIVFQTSGCGSWELAP